MDDFPFFSRFLSPWSHVIRWGYRQKHRSQVLFSLPLTGSDHQLILALDTFRQTLADACGKSPDNHECYELWWTNNETHKGPIFVTFSDDSMHVHLEAKDQDGGKPSGWSSPQALTFLPANKTCHKCGFTNRLQAPKEGPRFTNDLPFDRQSGYAGYRCPECNYWQES